MPTSSLLEMENRVCVVDCGLGVTRGVVEAGTALKNIDLIFITHLHSDHILELGPLLHTAWTCGLNHKITVFGPPGIREYVDGFLGAMRYDIDLRITDEGRKDIRELVEIVILDEGNVLDGDFEVSALRVNHPPVEDCFALRFCANDWRVTFSSDTAMFPPLSKFAFRSDILVHEAMLSKGIDRIVARTANARRLREHLLASHTEASDVAQIASDAEVRHLVLHHLVPSDDPEIYERDWVDAVSRFWSGRVTVAHDGMEIGKGES